MAKTAGVFDIILDMIMSLQMYAIIPGLYDRVCVSFTVFDAIALSHVI